MLRAASRPLAIQKAAKSCTAKKAADKRAPPTKQQALDMEGRPGLKPFEARGALYLGLQKTVCVMLNP